MTDNKPVIAFGEIVWDIFPDKTVIGGAPLNVAYHLQAQKRESGIVSRVGEDELGKQTLRRVAELGVAVDGIQVDPQLPTGRVYVSFDENSEPGYEIVEPAAWDNIQAQELPQRLTPGSFHLVYGTLAQRSEASCQTLELLFDRAVRKFYDVNLRPPFTTRDRVAHSLTCADLVKVNREELRQLNDWFLLQEGDDRAVARRLIEAFDLEVVAVTNSAKGAALISCDEHVEHPGFSVTQADPVGSGDAFFSALIHCYLEGQALPDCLIAANKLGSWVASQSGATPQYP